MKDQSGIPLFVAEISSNHNQDLNRCFQFIDKAAEIGCTAVKFQLFKIDQLFAPEILGKSEEHRRRKAWELPVSFLPDLAARCRMKRLQFGCTPFYLKAVGELLSHVDFYKIASYELLWNELLRTCAQTGKPVVLSTGMATMDEVKAAVNVLADSGCKDLTLLHCVSAYPTPVTECNLAAIETLRNTFTFELSPLSINVGWSDHSVNPGVIHRAIHRWGAGMIEFHLDLDGVGEEFETGHCWLPDQIGQVIQTTRFGFQADGKGEKIPSATELPDRDWRADPGDGLRPVLKTRVRCREKAVAFVVVRLSSSRFRAKQCRLIGDRPLLCWITDRLKNCKELDEIVITTVAEESNLPLREFAGKEGVSCFWYEGGVNHVTTRLRRAAEAFDADICLLISGDCPLVYAPAIDGMIIQLRSDPEADIVKQIPEKAGQTVAHYGVGAARKRAWQLADDMSDRPELKEHHFPIIGIHPELFKTTECTVSENLCAPFHRLFVDAWADLDFMNMIYGELKEKNRPFELPEVLSLLKEKPELREINSHVHQRQVIEDVKRVLLVADAGREFGYGHLMRSIELALQIIERLGYPVTFLVDDKQAATMLDDLGVGIAWGALERPAMSAPDNYGEQNVDELLMNYDLVLLDTYCQRDFPLGWRKRFGNEIPVIVLDKCEQWAMEADLIIIPGVTGPSNRSEKTVSANEILNKAGEKQPNILWGQNYVILRREIRKAKNLNLNLKQRKDIDILAYLHPPEQREAVERFAPRNNLETVVVHEFTSDFPQLLARARFFLSSFGYSFYEALALGAFPVTWPLSEFHHNDCLVFYRRMGLSPIVIRKEEELEATLLPILAGSEHERIAVEDGTPSIIGEIAELLRKSHEVRRQ